MSRNLYVAADNGNVQLGSNIGLLPNLKSLCVFKYRHLLSDVFLTIIQEDWRRWIDWHDSRRNRQTNEVRNSDYFWCWFHNWLNSVINFQLGVPEDIARELLN